MRCWPLCTEGTPQSQAPGKQHCFLSVSCSLPPQIVSCDLRREGVSTGSAAQNCRY